LKDARLLDANLQDADLAGANLRNADVTNASFKVANLKGTLITADQLKKTRPPEDIPYFQGVSWEAAIDNQ
jgi:uncharacterized protein YjbI with pentapeptide repeats